MIFETLVLMPVLPITSITPVNEQCKIHRVKVQYGFYDTVKTCSLKDYRITKLENKNEK